MSEIEWKELPSSSNSDEIEWKALPGTWKPSSQLSSIPETLGQGLKDTARAGAEFIGSIPSAITGAVGGLVHLAGSTSPLGMALRGTTTPDYEGALKSAHAAMEPIAPHQYARNIASAARQLGANESGRAVEQNIDAFRRTPAHHEVVERPMGSLVMGIRDQMAAADRGKNQLKETFRPSSQRDPYFSTYESQEKAGDAGELALILSGGVGLLPRTPRGSKGHSARDIAMAEELRKRETERNRPYAEAEEAGLQGAAAEAGIEWATQRAPQEAAARAYAESLPFEPYELLDPATRAGRRRAKWLESSPPQEPTMETIPYERRMDSYQEDPYPRSLKEEFDKHEAAGNRARNPDRKAEHYAKADEVVAEAQRYAKEDYGFEAPDHYSGNLWGTAERSARGIERTGRPDMGVPETAGRYHDLAQKTERPDLSKRPMRGGRQAGAINPDVFREGFEKIKELAEGIRIRAKGAPERLYVTVEKDGEKYPIASANFDAHPWGKEHWPNLQHLSSEATHVDNGFRGRKYATEMYRFVSELGNDIKPDALRSKQGHQMWDAWNKSGFAKNDVIPLSSKGPRGRQRGTIDLDLLTLGVPRLIKTLGESKTFNKFKGTFASTELARLEKESRDPMSRSRAVWMSPQEFLDVVSPLEPHSSKSASIRQGLDTSEGLRQVPLLLIDKDGVGVRVVGHEGRHRMLAFSKEGLTLVPVELRGRFESARNRNGEYPFTELFKEGEQTSESIPFPKTINFEAATKGWNKQSGAIDLTPLFDPEKPLRSNPEYLKFKDGLPEALKGQARSMWKEIEQKDAARKAAKVEVFTGETKDRILKKLPVIRGWVDEVTPLPTDPAIIKERLTAEPDLASSKAALQLLSGARIVGTGSQHSLVRYIGEAVNRIWRKSSMRIDELILNKDTGIKPKWERLTDDERGPAWAAMVEAEGKVTLTRDQLFEAGFNEKQVDAIDTLRTAFNRVLDEDINVARAAVGKPPVERRPGYISSRFRGDWMFNATNAEGKFVEKVGTFSRRESHRVKEWLQQQFPDWTFSKTKHEPLHRFKSSSEAQVGYQAILESLSDDVQVRALEDAYSTYLKNQAYNVLAFKKHFLNKSGIGGAEGFKVWKDAQTNAKEGLKSVMNYMDHAIKWAETQHVSKQIKELLKDPEIVKNHPNAVAYAQAYLDNAFGKSTKLARALDTIIVDGFAKTTGIGQSLQLAGIRNAKAYGNFMLLGGWNLGFSISQFLQIAQTVPAWMQYFKDAGAQANILQSLAKGGHEAALAWTGSVDAMSSLSKEAWSYANKYGIIKPTLLDEVRSLEDKTTHKAVHFAMYGNMEIPEAIARTHAYMGWVHFLDMTREFPNKQHLFEAAANLTDVTMVDYRNIERPMLYNQLGVIGQLTNSLTSYKHNYYSQWWALQERTSQRQLVAKNTGRVIDHATGKVIEPPNASHAWKLPLIASTLTFGGLLGVYAREDVDALITAVNKTNLLNYYWPAHALKAGSKKLGYEINLIDKRIPTLRELFMRAPDAFAFGALSEFSDLWPGAGSVLPEVNLSSKFSAANVLPDNPMGAAFPMGSVYGNVAEAGAKFAANPSLTTGVNAIDSILPKSLKGVPEWILTKIGQTSKTVDPDKLTGKQDRDWKDWTARAAALETTKESRAKHVVRTNKENDEWMEQRRASVLEAAKLARFEGRVKDIPKLAQRYSKFEGDPATFINSIYENLEARQMTELQRQLFGNMDNAARQKRLVR